MLVLMCGFICVLVRITFSLSAFFLGGGGEGGGGGWVDVKLSRYRTRK